MGKSIEIMWHIGKKEKESEGKNETEKERKYKEI